MSRGASVCKQERCQTSRAGQASTGGIRDVLTPWECVGHSEDWGTQGEETAGRGEDQHLNLAKTLRTLAKARLCQRIPSLSF